VYNEQLYLKSCLDSIAAQTDMPDEVLVVDNNSRDDTVAVAREYPFVTVIREKRQGIVYARNAGFNAAKGDIIARFDADSRLHPDWVASAKRYFAREHDVEAVTGRCYFYDFPAKKVSQVLHNSVYYTLQSWIADGCIMWGSNMAMTRAAWLGVRGRCHETTRVHEDIDLSINLLKAGYRTAFTDELVADVSLRRGNVGFGDTRKYLAGWAPTYKRNGWRWRSYAIRALSVVALLASIPVSIITHL
jgi:glycosyltransferase involved in cell wall biosynthesis